MLSQPKLTFSLKTRANLPGQGAVNVIQVANVIHPTVLMACGSTLKRSPFVRVGWENFPVYFCRPN